MIFAAFRALAVHAAQLRAALTPRTIAEAADEHWAQATRPRDGADRLADKEAAEECWEAAGEKLYQCADPSCACHDDPRYEPYDAPPPGTFASDFAPDRPVPGIDDYPPSNPSNQSSCVDGEAATVVGPPMQGSPAASVSADPDAAGLPDEHAGCMGSYAGCDGSFEECYGCYDDGTLTDDARARMQAEADARYSGLQGFGVASHAMDDVLEALQSIPISVGPPPEPADIDTLDRLDTITALLKDIRNLLQHNAPAVPVADCGARKPPHRCTNPTGHSGQHANIFHSWTEDESSAAPVSNETPDAAAENGPALSDSARPGGAGPPELAPWELFNAARAARELARTQADGWADLADRLQAAARAAMK